MARSSGKKWKTIITNDWTLINRCHTEKTCRLCFVEEEAQMCRGASKQEKHDRRWEIHRRRWHAVETISRREVSQSLYTAKRRQRKRWLFGEWAPQIDCSIAMQLCLRRSLQVLSAAAEARRGGGVRWAASGRQSAASNGRARDDACPSGEWTGSHATGARRWKQGSLTIIIIIIIIIIRNLYSAIMPLGGYRGAGGTGR